MTIFEKTPEFFQKETPFFGGGTYLGSGRWETHFHREYELFGVIKGNVAAAISGEKKELSDGQIAVISSLENHSYEMEEQAEVFCFHVGAQYLMEFQSLYQDRQLPRWLMDAAYNQIIYGQIKPLLDISTEQVIELRRVGIICELISDIIAHYGTVDKRSLPEMDDALITEVLQYIYEHYNEDITLEFLADKFCIPWKTLGKRLYQRTNVDLRIFVNDIRLQKVMQMLDDCSNRNKSLDEILSLCGFHNKATFYRCYERCYGRSFK